MTAFEEYVDALVSGKTADDDFPKNESSREELFDFGKRRISEIVILRKENASLRERIAQLEAAQHSPAGQHTSGAECDCGNPSGRVYEATVCWDCDRLR
jgi:hypothetical protein